MVMRTSSLRRRYASLGFLLAALFLIIYFMLTPDLPKETDLYEQLAESQADLRENTTSKSYSKSQVPWLIAPSIYDFLPHLSQNLSSLKPAYLLSKGRSEVSIVLGIPTVKREVQSYLIYTLRNLIENMDSKESADCLIVVFVAETDLNYVIKISHEIETQFPEHVESGLIEVISPSPSYYPDFNTLKLTLGNTLARVKWRSKQNIDFAFLMMYSQIKGLFYLQLEDDIITKKHYITTMKTFAMKGTSENVPWIVLEFCQLGFIGKMFKCSDLHWFIQFFIMFFNDKPIDWLLEDFFTSKFCSIEYDANRCRKAKEPYSIKFKPSLFQHIGTHSSLKGKVQKLKDKQFGTIALFSPHKNPPAKAESSIKFVQRRSLQEAYNGKTFYWGELGHPGDLLTFTFESPIPIERFLFVSGNADHPADIFVNTTVEVLPVTRNASSTTTSDGYVVVGQFDPLGLAQGTITGLGEINVLRLHVHTKTNNWLLLSEILIEKIQET